MRRIWPYTDTNGDSYTDANSYRYTHAYTYTYTCANPVLGAVYTNTATSPHTSTTSIALVDEKEIHYSIRLV